MIAQKLPVAAAALTPQELFKRCSPAVVRVVVRDKKFAVIGLGSGFFVSADGLLVTNYHVIEKADFASVLLASNATLFVEGVAAMDPNADLAILKVNGTGLDFLHLATGDPPPVGAKVYAIGNPQGLTNTLSEGLVSAHRDANGALAMIQTTAPISPGSSGGPLLTEDGKVEGVTKSYLDKGQNLNFAVPAEKVRSLLGKRGKVQTLASAGGLRLEKDATKKLDQAWAAMRRKDWSGASVILTELRKTERENPLVWFALGYLHAELGNHDIAIEQYKQAIALKPDFANAYGGMGLAYSDLGRHAEAIAAYQKGITFNPECADAYYFMGNACGSLGRHAEAIAAYQKAIALKFDDALAYYRMGLAYRGLGRHPEAIAAYQKAIALKPDFADAYYFMGSAYGCLGRHAEAIASYQKAIALKFDDALAYYSMGDAYAKLGRNAEAIAAYRECLRLDPQGSLAADAREAILRLSAKRR